ncbi:hypothetical protein, partial [Methylobacterium sp. Leaf361]|uniref:hypothetical protein n=1 Tax=Methylobacterium sp. Leaf361 TaxID=1736352 RepID=UPI0012FEB09E
GEYRLVDALLVDRHPRSLARRAQTGRGASRSVTFDQRFVEVLLPINVNRDDQSTKLSADVSVFKDFPSSFMLVASELQSDISTKDVPFGGRCSSEVEGVLSFGPFISLEPGQYHLVFRYRADGSINEECGWADGSVCILGSARSLGKIILTGTDGKTERAHLFINIDLEKHERFSIRVYTNGLRTVTLFDVRVDLIRRP